MNTITTAEINGIQYQLEDVVARPRQVDIDNDFNLDNFTQQGVYKIDGTRLQDNDNLPILNKSVVSATLTVLITDDHQDNIIITQVLTLNNNSGGESNIYIRSCQNGVWKSWGKLQTNVEVGQVNTLDNLTDNGIYSGVLTDGTPTSYGTYYDTFVLIVINNYSVAGGTGTSHCISQLKYSLKLGGEIVIQKRTSVSGSWGEWSNVGNKYELPVATNTTLGGVRIGIGMGISGDGCLNLRIGTGLIYTGGDVEVSIGSGLDFDSTGIRVNNGFGLNISGNGGKLEWGNYSTWSSSSNMNNYTIPGVYRFYGERTNANDNLPITQAYNGASFYAVLTVVASTLQPDNTEKCVTQFLQLSNRMGGEGNTYIRTYNKNNNGLNGWSEWKKQQGMVESYINTNTAGVTMTGSQTTGLNGMTDNGMYSGIYTDDITLSAPTFVETFVLVVINDYAVSSQAGTPRRISQLKYATDTLTGQCTVKKRVGTGSDSISWGDWEEIGGGSSEVDITDTVKQYGLPTLIEQGMAKEGVTYKASSEMGEFGWLGKLDVNGKIENKISNILGGIDSKITALVKIIDEIVVVEIYQRNMDSSSTESTYLHYHKFIMDMSCTIVKVSADMTEL